MYSIVLLREEARPYPYISFHAGYIRIFTHRSVSAAAPQNRPAAEFYRYFAFSYAFIMQPEMCRCS